jgi:hypothetical protein
VSRYVCPECGTVREALKNAQYWHPCPKRKIGRGRSRFVELVEQKDEDAA